MYGSFLSALAFLKNDLITWTVFFCFAVTLWVYLGNDVMCLNPFKYDRLKEANSADA